MGIFDLFKKKQKREETFINNTNTSIDEISENIRTKKEFNSDFDNRNFIGDLVSYFESNSNVKEAAFGMVPLNSNGQPTSKMFLGIKIDGDEEPIKNLVWMLKQTYHPELNINFASNLTNPKFIDFIFTKNFSFYSKDKELKLEQLILKAWFEPENYKTNLIDTLKCSEIVTLVRDFDESSNILTFQNYGQLGNEFIPLFLDKEMIFKSGMEVIPDNLTAIQFDFKAINELLKGGLEGQTFILNPGTVFETEFIA